MATHTDLVGMAAALFDLDGVLTDTAAVHALAWAEVLTALLESLGCGERDRFTDDDYRRHLDGRTRLDGVRTFLAAHGLELPEGEGDEPGLGTVRGVAAAKDRAFRRRLDEEGVRAFPDAVAFVRELRRRQLRTAVVSASRNCAAVLERAGLAGLFDARVDGLDAARLGLAGKPAPDLFVEAARRLAAPPGRCAAVEDAAAGVTAARRAGVGLVIAVDRTGDRGDALVRAGADLVVRGLDEVPLGERPPSGA